MLLTFCSAHAFAGYDNPDETFMLLRINSYLNPPNVVIINCQFASLKFHQRGKTCRCIDGKNDYGRMRLADALSAMVIYGRLKAYRKLIKTHGIGTRYPEHPSLQADLSMVADCRKRCS